MNIDLRQINEDDCDLLYKWANDPLVRTNAFNDEKISYDEHKKWFKKKNKSNKSFIYIGELKGNPVGQIRIDVEDSRGVIDFSIAKKYRGKGLGAQLLKKIIFRIKDNEGIYVKILIGKVKFDNIASQKSFEKAGYCKVKKDNYIKYYKSIN